MEKILIFNLLLLLSTFAQAQFFDKHAIYQSGGISFGNYAGIDANLNYIYQEKYSIQVGISFLIRRPVSLPNDFDGSTFSRFYAAMFPILYFFDPWDEFESYNLLIGRVKKLNEKGSIRLNLRGGLGYTKVVTAQDWQRKSSSSSSNYDFRYNRVKSIGFIFKPEMEFLLNRYFGLSVSPFLLFSSRQKLAYGVQLGIMVGILRKNNSSINN